MTAGRSPGEQDDGLAWVERNWWLLSASSDVPRPTGPDRTREAIARDRGHYAPTQPVTLCGQPDGTEKTVAEWGRLAATRGPSTSLGERLIGLIHCPACLQFRWNPGHWLSCGGWRTR